MGEAITKLSRVLLVSHEGMCGFTNINEA